MPFTFVFNGSFADLYHLFQQLDASTVEHDLGRTAGQRPAADDPERQARADTSSPKAKPRSTSMTGTITATAYVLPAAQGLTGGATSATPAAARRRSGATSASSEQQLQSTAARGRSGRSGDA